MARRWWPSASIRPSAARRTASPIRHVLLAGGLGIPQRFYAKFASWLVERGYAVMTFDLRGMGRSRRPEHQRSLRGLDAEMLTWARLDFGAAVQTLSHDADGRPIGVLGHSLGTHHAAMTNAAAQATIGVVVSVAAGTGHWRGWATPSRRRAPWTLHLAGPLLTPLLGYFPGRRLKMVGDLPGPAMRQWTRWCRHPQFAWGAEPEQVVPSLARAAFRIEALSFTDDEAMAAQFARQLLSALKKASSRLHCIEPADVGLQRIGHVGAFRAEASVLWPLFEAAMTVDRGRDRPPAPAT